MQTTDAIIAEIDTLIDDQLAVGEPMNGYDFDDPDFPTCWHCGRDWHGLAITERMNEMRALGAFDEGYRIWEDLRGGLTVWGFDLGEWTPANAPTPALPDVRDLEAEGWRPVGLVPDGFVFEIAEPQVDDVADMAFAFRERVEARTCEYSAAVPEEPAAPLDLPVSPAAQRRPPGLPFWAARMDGRR
ncbi:hypothetical protein SEA_BBQVALINDRA_64 [Gordonia phage BBQValindra]|nr:hypothetical protein SEA_BBQVALINDRA_64 [Gordonia phage BBQValindra]